MARWMGLDFGTARTGIALVDTEVGLAAPHSVVSGDLEQRLAGVARVARAEKIVSIVVGLPLSLEGFEGAAARRARRFVERLQRDLPDIDFHFQDERFSSQAIERLRTKKDKRELDAAAAAWILQSFLEANSSKGVT